MQRAVLGAPTHVWSVHFHGHGNSGVIQAGRHQIALDVAGERARMTQRDPAMEVLSVLQFAAFLQPCLSRLTNPALLTLDGCRVGSGPRGQQFLRALATVLPGVVIQAPNVDQLNLDHAHAHRMRIGVHGIQPDVVAVQRA
jgi:hypothetical protein